MVDLEELARRAERTAARSRARMACRVCVPVAMIAIAPIASGGSLAACACIAVALFAVTAWLRWRDRIGGECVTTGLALGSVPVVAALLLRGCGVECRGLSELAQLSGGEVACLIAGAVTGLGVTWRVTRSAESRPQRWIATMLIASATAALGCVGLGVAALGSTLLAVFAVASLALIPMAARAA